MLNPRLGGATPGELDIFREAKVKFPTPRTTNKSQIPPPRVTFSLKVK